MSKMRACLTENVVPILHFLKMLLASGEIRGKLRSLKKDGFQFKPHAGKRRRANKAVLSGFTSAVDDLLHSAYPIRLSASSASRSSATSAI